MSTYVTNNLKCNCGHTGKINLHEGDGPSFWENYTLEGLDGESFSSPTAVNMITVLENMHPSCPVCKAKIVKENLEWL